MQEKLQYHMGILIEKIEKNRFINLQRIQKVINYPVSVKFPRLSVRRGPGVCHRKKVIINITISIMGTETKTR